MSVIVSFPSGQTRACQDLASSCVPTKLLMIFTHHYYTRDWTQNVEEMAWIFMFIGSPIPTMSSTIRIALQNVMHVTISCSIGRISQVCRYSSDILCRPFRSGKAVLTSRDTICPHHSLVLLRAGAHANRPLFAEKIRWRWADFSWPSESWILRFCHYILACDYYCLVQKSRWGIFNLSVNGRFRFSNVTMTRLFLLRPSGEQDAPQRWIPVPVVATQAWITDRRDRTSAISGTFPGSARPTCHSVGFRHFRQGSTRKDGVMTVPRELILDCLWRHLFGYFSAPSTSSPVADTNQASSTTDSDNWCQHLINSSIARRFLILLVLPPKPSWSNSLRMIWGNQTLACPGADTDPSSRLEWNGGWFRGPGQALLPVPGCKQGKHQWGDGLPFFALPPIANGDIERTSRQWSTLTRNGRFGGGPRHRFGSFRLDPSYPWPGCTVILSIRSPSRSPWLWGTPSLVHRCRCGLHPRVSVPKLCVPKGTSASTFRQH
jgi:hypothetical protein